jgi:hypothetical protein
MYKELEERRNNLVNEVNKIIENNFNYEEDKFQELTDEAAKLNCGTVLATLVGIKYLKQREVA